jgi:hypothetical protein
MKRIKLISAVPMALAILGMVTATILTAVTPAEAARRGVAARCGARGCAAVSTRRVPVVRPAMRRGVVVVNPGRYWRPGGAIAAGAAIGFIAGAAAASIAGPPPQAGYCWFYTNSSRTTGFWDICPR